MKGLLSDRSRFSHIATKPFKVTRNRLVCHQVLVSKQTGFLQVSADLFRPGQLSFKLSTSIVQSENPT